MVDEKEFYADVEIVDVVPKEITAQLKSQRDEIMQLYAKLIANPYLAPQLVPDFRSTLMSTVATLMENGIPVSTDPKIRTPDDVIREGMAELGGMLGGKVVGGIMKMKQGFENSMRANQEEDFTVYRDPDTGDYYFIDKNGDEVDCDQHGNPLE